MLKNLKSLIFFTKVTHATAVARATMTFQYGGYFGFKVICFGFKILALIKRHLFIS
jgi:hypothetical protein